MRFGVLVFLLYAFQAHSFPIAGKPVRIVVPFPPGGQTDAETRKGALPDLPTMREAGYDVGMWGYLWFWGPAGGAVIRELGVKLD